MPTGRQDVSAERQTYTAGQVARTLGVPTATLRAWHRRYGVAPHADKDGGYRRYGADDIMRLEHMRDLIRAGALASDAANMVMAQHGAGPDLLREQLLQACRRLDGPGGQKIIARALRTFGAVAAWELLCRPAMHEIEAEQLPEVAAAPCIPQEHVLSWAVGAALRNHATEARRAQPVRVLLACVEAEQHTLPLEVLAAVLAERGVPAAMLGASVPHHALAEAVRTLSPRVLVLWAQSSTTAAPDQLPALRRLPVSVMTAGPGWPTRNLSTKDHLSALGDAVAALTDHPAP